MLRNAGNPNAMMMQMLQTSPKGREVMEQIRQANGDPEAALRAACKQKGIDPDQFMNEIQNGF